MNTDRTYQALSDVELDTVVGGRNTTGKVIHPSPFASIKNDIVNLFADARNFLSSFF